MADSFDVSVKSADLLHSSLLVTEIGEHLESRPFPVLVDGRVVQFENVGGGYNLDEEYHVVKLTTSDEEPLISHISSVEVHTDGSYFYLDVEDFRELFDDDEYTLALQVSTYRRGPYSFKDAMMEDVDKRETEYSYE